METSKQYSKNKKQKNEERIKETFKELYLELHEYDKKDVALIFEYSDYNGKLAFNILSNSTKSQIKDLLKSIIKNPENYEHIVESYCQENKILISQFTYETEIPNKTQDAETKLNKSEKEPQEDFFFKYFIPDSVIYQTLCFFDPYDLVNFSLTCKKFNEFAKTSSLYRKFCEILFRPQRTLPQISLFDPLLEYIEKNKFEFHPEFVNSARKGIREIVWGEFGNKRTNKNFFKQFDNFFEIFMKAPRINFCGVYKIKDTYFKVVPRDGNQNYDPCILVTYYRYIQFLNNGTFRMIISSKAMKNDKLLKFMFGEYDESDQFSKGEYITFNDKVKIAYLKGSTIFEFHLTILHNYQEARHLLKIDCQKMRELDIKSEKIIFDGEKSIIKTIKYHYMPSFRKFLPDELKMISH